MAHTERVFNNKNPLNLHISYWRSCREYACGNNLLCVVVDSLYNTKNNNTLQLVKFRLLSSFSRVYFFNTPINFCTSSCGDFLSSLLYVTFLCFKNGSKVNFNYFFSTAHVIRYYCALRTSRSSKYWTI